MRVVSSIANPDPVDSELQPTFRMRTAIRRTASNPSGDRCAVSVGENVGASDGTTSVGIGPGSPGSTPQPASAATTRPRTAVRVAGGDRAGRGRAGRPAVIRTTPRSPRELLLERDVGVRRRLAQGVHLRPEPRELVRVARARVLQVADEPVLAVHALVGRRGHGAGPLGYAPLVVGELALDLGVVAELRLLVRQLG